MLPDGHLRTAYGLCAPGMSPGAHMQWTIGFRLAVRAPAVYEHTSSGISLLSRCGQDVSLRVTVYALCQVRDTQSQFRSSDWPASGDNSL